jgi:hypothetical protein
VPGGLRRSRVPRTPPRGRAFLARRAAAGAAIFPEMVPLAASSGLAIVGGVIAITITVLVLLLRAESRDAAAEAADEAARQAADAAGAEARRSDR